MPIHSITTIIIAFSLFKDYGKIDLENQYSGYNYNKLYQKYPLTILLLGISLGLLSGVLGVGGGFFIVPTFLTVFKARMKTATATSLAIVSIVLVASLLYKLLYHELHESLELPFIIIFVANGLLGNCIGMFISESISENYSKVICGICMIILGVIKILFW